MKCLRCDQECVPGKALCATCFSQHEARISHEQSAAWLDQTLASTRDKYRQQLRANSSSSPLRKTIEVAVLVGAVGGLLVYLLLLKGQRGGLQPAQSQASTQPPETAVGRASATSAGAAVTPFVDSVTRTVWVGSSAGSIPLIFDALELVKKRDRGTDMRWVVRLEPGDHYVTAPIVVPSFVSISGTSIVDSTIRGISEGSGSSDPAASMITLEPGAGLENLTIVHQGAGAYTAAIACRTEASLQVSAAEPVMLHTADIQQSGSAQYSYGVLNSGCTLTLSAVNLTLNRSEPLGVGILTTNSRAQTELLKSSVHVASTTGPCRQSDQAGCIALKVESGTVSVKESKISAGTYGTTASAGTIQFVSSTVQGETAGVLLSGVAQLSTIDSQISTIENSSSGEARCLDTRDNNDISFDPTCQKSVVLR